jgi:hypothetical protein
VLWYNSGPDIYSVNAAFPSITQCDANLQAVRGRLASEGYETMNPSDHVVAITYAKKGTVPHEERRWRVYLCLPDTIDPRGPKGR